MKLLKDNNMFSFSIPTHFDNAILKRILQEKSKGEYRRQIVEIYGCLNKSIIGHGRAANSVTPINSTSVR
jgi:hypothetical protein